MIKVEGYKAFYGTMRLEVPGTCSEREVTGGWLYKPETACWYCDGRSYPVEVCRPVRETGVDTDSTVGDLAGEIQIVLSRLGRGKNNEETAGEAAHWLWKLGYRKMEGINDGKT